MSDNYDEQFKERLRAVGVDVELGYYGGVCPVQVKGTMNGQPFYFRARHGYWDLTVVKPGCSAVMPKSRDEVVHFADGDDESYGYAEAEEALAMIEVCFRVFVGIDTPEERSAGDETPLTPRPARAVLTKP